MVMEESLSDEPTRAQSHPEEHCNPSEKPGVHQHDEESDQDDEPAPRGLWHTLPRLTERLWSLAVHQWFLIALGLLIAIASQVQVPAPQQHVKEILITYLCVSIIFFITGCTIDPLVLLKNYSRWKIHFFVQIQCFLVNSAIVFGIVSATATNKHFMDPGLLVGLIFFGCIPTTISSNVVFTKEASGNQALTVVETTIGNLIAVFLTPALVVMYTNVNTWYNRVVPLDGKHFAAIYRRVLMQLGLSVYLPLVAGQVTRKLFPRTSKRVLTDWRLNKLGSICLLLIIWQTFDGAFESGAFDVVSAADKIFLVFISILLWFLFFAMAFCTSLPWLPRKDVVSVCFCVPAKGPAMGVPLIDTVFANIAPQLKSKIQIPVIIFQGFQLAFGAIVVPIFRRWIERTESDNTEAQ